MPAVRSTALCIVVSRKKSSQISLDPAIFSSNKEKNQVVAGYPAHL